MKIDLEDLVPTRVEFSLASAPDEKFAFRPVSLEDHNAMAKRYGGEELAEIFRRVRVPLLIEIAYSQLELESKQFFKKRTVKIVNEEGDELDVQMGGLQLFRALIVGPKETMMVVESLLKAVGVSQPLVDKLEAAQKKSDEDKLAMQTGQRSSTPSVPSTDGQPSTSSPAP